jgi:hypothetical protein
LRKPDTAFNIQRLQRNFKYAQYQHATKNELRCRILYIDKRANLSKRNHAPKNKASKCKTQALAEVKKKQKAP